MSTSELGGSDRRRTVIRTIPRADVRYIAELTINFNECVRLVSAVELELDLQHADDGIVEVRETRCI